MSEGRGQESLDLETRRGSRGLKLIRGALQTATDYRTDTGLRDA